MPRSQSPVASVTPQSTRSVSRRYGLRAWPLLLLAACATTGKSACDDCRRLVISAIGEPPSLLPPLVQETVGRDISALVFERLLELAPGGAPLDSAAWRPALAESWSRPDDTTVVLTLRAGARWHDGRPVTADDVVFSYAAFADTAIGAPGLPSLAGIHVAAVDTRTVRATVPAGSTEPLYDLTFGVRILPRHIWGEVPSTRWPEDTALAHLVGSGRYRLASWRRGEFLRLVADSADGTLPPIDTLVWRFSGSPSAAATLLLAHEADVMETLITPDILTNVRADSSLRVVRYPSAAYGFLAWRVAPFRRGAAPRAADARVRQALGLALDRAAMATAILGAGTAVPQGPLSQALWLHDAVRPVAPGDTALAARMLTGAGWVPGPDGMRSKNGVTLAAEILVPSSSSSRVLLAQAVIEAWRRLGVAGTVASVEFPVFQQRLAEGNFDAYIGSYLDEPSPRGLAVQWGTSGIGALNHGGWSDRPFDSLLTHATRARSVAEAKVRYRVALDRLESEAPAVFLFAPTAAMGVNVRVTAVEPIDPFNWLGSVARWSKRPRRASDR